MSVALDGVTKRFGTYNAVDDVSITFQGPQIVSLLGPNGAGKTTTIDLICGTQAPTSGTVKLFGRVPDRAVRRRIGVVMQDEFVLHGMTVRDYAELFSAIYGVDGRIIEEAELTDKADVQVTSLSGGQAARLFIASALVHRPDVLLLDEPTAHLDPEAKRRTNDWLEALSKERLVIVSTHDLAEAERLSDRVVVIVAGKVKRDGSPQELAAAHGSLSEAYLSALR